MRNDKPHVTIEAQSRRMMIPEETRCIGVAGDNRAERVDIDFPRWYDGIDLGGKHIYIIIHSEAGESDTVEPEVTADAETLHAVWTVSAQHTARAGRVYARIRVTDTDGFVWQSLDGEFSVESVRSGAGTLSPGQTTAVNQALLQMTAAKEQAQLAVEAMSPPIISAARGVASVAADSADRPLRGLTVYGRTTQDGTATEGAPVDLAGAGSASPLRIVTAGKNLAVLTPRLEENFGITSSYDAQTGVVTVTGTATQMAFVSYWLRELIPAGTSIVVGMGNESSDGNITIRAQSASESANTTIATLDSANKVVKATLKHAFEFLTIRVNAGATVNMKLRIGVTVGSSVTGYAWTHPDEPTGARIAMPVWHTAVGGLLQGVPAPGSDATYVDADGQGWIADTIEYDAQTGTAQIVRRVASVTYDGNASEGWVKGGSNSYFAIRHTDKSSASHGLCTHYQGLAINAGESKVGFTAATDASYIRFRPAGYADMTVDAWRAQLNASPVTVLYALAVPEMTPITGDELAALTALRSRYPATTAFNDAGAQMAVRYVADTKNYVDQKIEQLTNAVVSTGANI